MSLLIIVPTLNSYELLPRLVSSLQAQTMPDWRLLFIDGPSGPEHRNWLEACCSADPRFMWVEQAPNSDGIFGAMTQGFFAAGPNDWLLFWGSDDWPASNQSLAHLMQILTDQQCQPDLVVCTARYVDSGGKLTRRSTFYHRFITTSGAGGAAWLDLFPRCFRRCLFLGASPPHQATLFGPAAIQKINSYKAELRLAADLDYFLRLSKFTTLRVRVSSLELVHMSEGGVSAQHTRRRLKEVYFSYQWAFGWFWIIPFLFRYVRRLSTRL